MTEQDASYKELGNEKLLRLSSALAVIARNEAIQRPV
jgi:hypothetical protein